MYKDMKVNSEISTVDGIPFDTVTVDIFEDRVQIQSFRTRSDDDAMVVAAPPIEYDWESWDKLCDLIRNERGNKDAEV